MARIAKSIDINAPAKVVYQQLTQFAEFPRFMEGVEEVRQTDDTHLHWRSKAGDEIQEWDSEITEQVPEHLIAWRNITDHKNNGKVELQAPAPDQTRVTMSMEFDYATPQDRSAEFEAGYAQRTEHNLQRFKDLVEQRDRSKGAPAAQATASEPWLPRLMELWEEPLGMMRKMTQEMDGVFERFLGRPFGLGQWSHSGGVRTWTPPVEVAQHDNRLVVQADLPGLSRDNVHVEIKGDQLIIEGDRPAQGEHPDQEYRRSERFYGHFYRTIPLPRGIDSDAASASMHDGVLEVTMPVTPQQRHGRRLDVEARRTP